MPPKDMGKDLFFVPVAVYGGHFKPQNLIGNLFREKLTGDGACSDCECHVELRVRSATQRLLFHFHGIARPSKPSRF
jgi:hypothetical protein